MADRLMALIAAATLAIFLGILVWKVPRVDLFVIVGITMALVIWDLLTGSGRSVRRR